MSSFPGRLIEYPFVSIDRFDNENLSSTLYFLSHCHQDHMAGLASEGLLNHLRKKDLRLYCHHITKALLLCDQRYQHLEPFIISLDTNDPRIVEVPVWDNREQPITIFVTLIPAHHCVGSVMFLFEGDSGNVLYTGDFRLTLTELKSFKHLKSGQLVKPIASLYIDTTFCSGKSLVFPSRDESFQVILTETRKWLAQSHKHKVLLFTASKYGHEYLFVQLHTHLGEKIHVAGWKVKGCESIESLSKCITRNPDEAKIHACSFWNNDNELDGLEIFNNPIPYGKRRNQQRIQCCRALERHSPFVLTIKPSTMYFHQNVKLKNTIKWESPNYLRVCYSIHSSFQEIRDFVSYLKPKRVRPNVIPIGSSLSEVLKCLEELIEPEVPSSANCSAHLNYNLPIVSVRRRRYKQESEMYEFNEEISEEVETAQHSPEIEIEKETVKKRKISIVQLD